MAGFKSTVKKRDDKLKSAAKKRKVSTVKSAASKQKSKIKSTVSKKKSKVKSAAKKRDDKFVDPATTTDTELRSTSLFQAPLGEAIDVRQEAANRVPDIQSVFDIETGFGIAAPGETGTAAVSRIKEEKRLKRKSKVKKRK